MERDLRFQRKGAGCRKGSAGVGYIDTAGTVIVTPRWASVSAPEQDGLVRVTNNQGLIGYVDLSDQVAMQPAWRYLAPRSGNIPMTTQNADG